MIFDDLIACGKAAKLSSFNLPKKIAFEQALTPGQVPLLALKHLGVQGAGTPVPVGGKLEEQSHRLCRTRRFRFRTTAFSGFLRPSSVLPLQNR
eukprot:350084-Rhodomonas_salina.1